MELAEEAFNFIFFTVVSDIVVSFVVVFVLFVLISLLISKFHGDIKEFFNGNS